MRRALLMSSLALLPSCKEKIPDFSGLWRMTETDHEYHQEYSQCFVRIEQQGDRATLHAWGPANNWTCEGRGVVEGGLLRFRWEGAQKHWRGTSELSRRGDELKGTYQRDEPGAAVQYCRGVPDLPPR
jgi:hypothetical protein